MSGRMAGHYFFILALLVGFVQAGGRAADFQPLAPAGQTFTHDPSSIVADGGKFYSFGTLHGIRVLSSPDLIHWTNEPVVFKTPPGWTRNVAPGFDGHIWAPDIIQSQGKFFLYYSISAWGKQTSAIGLAINDTLDARSPKFQWRDQGAVIRSTNHSPFNAIDPSAFLDTDGRLWLAFGSYWQGIFLTELDPRTGLRLATNSPVYHLAWNNSIEAACLTKHDRFYYLFINWGQCCRGTNSTYEIRVGRAETITGPYLDRDGKKLTDGGGSVFLQSTGRFIGPGHVGIFPHDGQTWFSYHYYDADSRGRSRLALGQLDWTTGWPVAVNHSPALTNHWQLVWADEFNTNGAPDPANWNYERGFVRNHELQWYQPENAVCTNGLLVIEARRERRANPDYRSGSSDWRKDREWIEVTSASLTSRRLREFTYGKFEMRARIDTRPGSWPAFWTLGARRGVHWPACGEIDIMEYYTGTVLANFGWQQNGKTKWLAEKKPLAELGDAQWSRQFHIWTMLWDKQKIDLLLDGQLINRLEMSAADQADQGNPFHHPAYIILNQAIGGDCGGDPSQTQFPIRFEVDWVRVFQNAD